MKVLEVFDFFSPRGGGTVDVVYQLSRALAGRGHEVTIFTSDFGLDQQYIDSLPEVKVYPFHCISSFGRFYVTPDLIAVVRTRLPEFDIVHVHCFRSFLNIVVHHYARKYGVPYVVDDHGSLPRAPGEGRGIKWAARWLFDVTFGHRVLNNAARLVTENRFGVRELEKFGVSGEKIAVIPLSFPVEDFAHLPPPGQFRRKYSLGDRRIVMSLGRINRVKGLDFLVESFHELSRSRQDVVLAIVGPDDGYRDKLERLVARRGLSERVLFTGLLGGQEKLAALVDADVMVQPSRFEQAAWAPIEAVLCGTPAIVTKDSGAGEDVSRMDAGYLVKFGDKRQMAQTIQAILDDPSEAREKARRAKEYINANLQFSRKVEDYEKLYRECVEANMESRRSKQ